MGNKCKSGQPPGSELDSVELDSAELDSAE
jgi:hypothetical protein